MQMKSGDKAQRLEPEVKAGVALWSPGTSLVAVGDLVKALVEEAGPATLMTGTEVRRVVPAADGLRVELSTGEVMRCDRVINSAGLGGRGVALRIDGFPAEHVPRVFHAKGSYGGLPAP